MYKAGKIWGETELILANNACEFHRIDYQKGRSVFKTPTRMEVEWFLLHEWTVKNSSVAEGL
jgi:hypothetical protein